MPRFAVASSSLPPSAAAAAALGFGSTHPRVLQSLTLAAAPPRGGSPPWSRRLCVCSSSSSTTAAVEEARRGRKQLGMAPQLYDYLVANVREHPILRELREETAAMRGSQMQVSPAQAQLLAMLAQILGAQRCIEVGVYTGYSSLAVALSLPESGLLVACERDERCLEVAKKYYQRAGVAHKVEEPFAAKLKFSQPYKSWENNFFRSKVDVKHALAADSLRSLINCGEASSYDFAFVDADKRMYEGYFELLLELVRVGGLIVMDNVLWYGRVADPLVNDPKTISIRNFNKKLLEDKRVNISMVPIGDGMTICQKIVDT